MTSPQLELPIPTSHGFNHLVRPTIEVSATLSVSLFPAQTDTEPAKLSIQFRRYWDLVKATDAQTDCSKCHTGVAFAHATRRHYFQLIEQSFIYHWSSASKMTYISEQLKLQQDEYT